VRPLPAGSAGAAKYEIVAGERRWQAAKIAGLADIPVVVRELTDSQAVAVALIDSKALSMGHARALLGLENDAERVRLGQLVAERGYSVRETENLVRKALKGEGDSLPGR